MPVLLEPLNPIDAIRVLAARGDNLVETFAWQEIWQRIHSTMFTVAKSTGHDILGDLHKALLKALSEGKTVRQFADEITPVLQQKGWWGRQMAFDPDAGIDVPVQLGSPSRLKLIFDVNMRVSYASGHWARFEAQKANRPYLRYVAIIDEVTRESHAALHNLVLPIDHPFWDVFAAPNGWNCRCTMQSLSKRDIERLQREGVPLKFDAPEIQWRPWTNKRTGETLSVPDGVDPGWAYNPGKTGFEMISSNMTAKQQAVIDQLNR